MFNMNGEVIGIVSHNISKSGGSEGLGFVVTINTAKKLLLEKRSFWTGLEGQLLTDAAGRPPQPAARVDRLHRQDGGQGLAGRAMGLRGATMIANLGGDQVPLGGDIILTVEGVKAEAANLAKIRDLLCEQARGQPVQGDGASRRPGARADRKSASEASSPRHSVPSRSPSVVALLLASGCAGRSSVAGAARAASCRRRSVRCCPTASG